MDTIELKLLKDIMDKFERMTIAQERIADSLELMMINASPNTHKPVEDLKND
jgi:hypothetical protein